MVVLGVDQSLRGTGLCLLSQDAEVLHLETVRPGECRGPARLAHIKARVAELLERGVGGMALEGYAYNAVGRVFELGEVGGVLQLLAFERGTPALIVPPTLLKKFAVGDASASKDVMVEAARQTGAAADDDNQADAYFLALIAWYVQRGVAPDVRARCEVLQWLKYKPAKERVRRVRKVIKNAL